MDKTIVISLLIFFLILYIEWNNINFPKISFMFDHRFSPHNTLEVTSLFSLKPNVKTKQKKNFLCDNKCKTLKNRQKAKGMELEKYVKWATECAETVSHSGAGVTPNEDHDGLMEPQPSLTSRFDLWPVLVLLSDAMVVF